MDKIREESFVNFLFSLSDYSSDTWYGEKKITSQVYSVPWKMIFPFILDSCKGEESFDGQWAIFENFCRSCSEWVGFDVHLCAPGICSFEYIKKTYREDTGSEISEKEILEEINDNIVSYYPDFSKELIKREKELLVSLRVQPSGLREVMQRHLGWRLPEDPDLASTVIESVLSQKIDFDADVDVVPAKIRKPKKQKEPIKIGIYRIFNEKCNRNYVGQSKNIHRRWKEHRTFYNSRKRHSVMTLHWIEHGEESFKFEILEECSEEMLHEREEHWIQLYNSRDILVGYNIK